MMLVGGKGEVLGGRGETRHSATLLAINPLWFVSLSLLSVTLQTGTNYRPLSKSRSRGCCICSKCYVSIHE